MLRVRPSPLRHPIGLAVCAFVVVGCRILGLSPVPCTSDSHCQPTDACVEGLCAPLSAIPDDGGVIDDDGGVPTDGGTPPDAGTPAAAASCADVRARDPSAETGLTEIFPPGRPEGVVVWCDQEIAGGGWMLIARSTSSGGGGAPWGYDAERGSPDDPDTPYSAGVTAFGLEATELLVVEVDGDGRPERNVYRLAFDEDVIASRTKTVTRVEFEIIESECASQIDVTQDHPWMFLYAGCTARTDVFMFRDNPSCDNYGLRPDGYSLNYDNCHQAAGMQDRDGAIYAR